MSGRTAEFNVSGTCTKQFQKDEAGEGHSHAPRRTPHPHRSLALCRYRLPGPHTSGSGHHTPNVPHAHSVSRKNGKIKLRLEFSPAQKMAKKARLKSSFATNLAPTATRMQRRAPQ